MEAQPADAAADKPRRKKEKTVVAIGTRKKAIARAKLIAGKGKVVVNQRLLENYEPKYARMRLREPLLLAGELANRVDIDVNVTGGGFWGQADAARTAIASALVQFLPAAEGRELRAVFMDYDRSLLISDSRRTEPHKPSRSSAGPRRMKQQSKR